MEWRTWRTGSVDDPDKAEKTTKLVAASRASSSTKIDRSDLLDHRSESLEMLPFGGDESHMENTWRRSCGLNSKLPLIQTNCKYYHPKLNDPRRRNRFLLCSYDE